MSRLLLFSLMLAARLSLADCGQGTAPNIVPAGAAIETVTLSDGGSPVDHTPPEQAVLREVRVQWPRTVGASAARHGCPQLDYLSFSVDGADDLTDAAALRVAVFVGPDEATVLAPATPVIELERFQSVVYRRIALTLGPADAHQRDGVGLRSTGRFCFAVALVDAAAQVGPRSKVECLDTTSPSDPHLEYFDEPLGACAAAGPSSLMSLMISLVGLTAVSRALRQSRRSR